MKPYDFLIAGAGPCGIGAAWTLMKEFPDQRFLLVDASPQPGGNAASEITPEGFIFDHGGHVLYPHPEFIEFRRMLEALGCEWHESPPIRGVYLHGRLIPAPIQNNLHWLPKSELIPILGDLVRLRVRSCLTERKDPREGTLERYLRSEFGNELTRRVMDPLNRKMWAVPPSAMTSVWVRERSGSRLRNVPAVRLRKLLKQAILKFDDPGWDAFTKVKYPARGGTGSIWRKAIAHLVPDQVRLNTAILEIDSDRKTALLGDGSRVKYSRLLSTIPLDILLSQIRDRPDMQPFANQLRKSSALLFGYGIQDRISDRYRGVHTFQCPDKHIPFWRVTIPSNVSPGNVPDPEQHYSVLCEISLPDSENRTISDNMRAQVRSGLNQLGLVREGAAIVSTFERVLHHGYPLPFLGRDDLLSIIHRRLAPSFIVSRGRFGGWRYETSNQDYAFTQGVQAARSLVSGAPETSYV